MAAATASIHNTTGTFMFHPRPAVFEHPITYDLPSLNNSTSIIHNKSDINDFSQYYITLESRTTIHKSAKGPISIAECDVQGKYIIIENTSRSKSMVLAGWTIRQESDNGDILTYTVPDNCLLRPNHSLKILTKPNESERKNSDLIASSLSSWHTGLNFVTTLINAEGKDRASLTKKTVFS
ncbi:unnamed protein product [Rotaria sp. Silwood1]|nr:unnamed protein product [Rotaria sp. Silwood1]CAF3349556.1 unnamed protein product [Rotaria sp. Silwood1]CAF3353747.1 unnamed protein product [Rotaria sp. Silwood1]CAF4573856.1 unnamed protein product [Rotaria sp. Silwood1]CAF4576749.1 unnamed protein product [Rotaria sp. Silwood1]